MSREVALLALDLISEQNLSQREAARRLGTSESTLRYWFGKFHTEGKVVVRKGSEGHKERRILFISDLHIPYHHPDAFAFLRYLKAKYNFTHIISVGDEVDGHGWSFHASDPSLYSAGHELSKAIDYMQELHDIFPEMDIVHSNHGSLKQRRALDAGLPEGLFKDYPEVYGTPGFKWHMDMHIELPNNKTCYVHHGLKSNIEKVGQQMGMCVVQGHYHSKCGIHYWNTGTDLLWAAQTGCLIDITSLAFAYGKNTLGKPVIGTTVVIDGWPHYEVLHPGTYNEYK